MMGAAASIFEWPFSTVVNAMVQMLPYLYQRNPQNKRKRTSAMPLATTMHVS